MSLSATFFSSEDDDERQNFFLPPWLFEQKLRSRAGPGTLFLSKPPKAERENWGLAFKDSPDVGPGQRDKICPRVPHTKSHITSSPLCVRRLGGVEWGGENCPGQTYLLEEGGMEGGEGGPQTPFTLRIRGGGRTELRRRSVAPPTPTPKSRKGRRVVFRPISQSEKGKSDAPGFSSSSSFRSSSVFSYANRSFSFRRRKRKKKTDVREEETRVFPLPYE